MQVFEMIYYKDKLIVLYFFAFHLTLLWKKNHKKFFFTFHPLE